LLSLRIELAFSKGEILQLYAAHAPFGGNVVGLEAASWRYFGHAPNGLSHAEYALLAVLPNAPTTFRPGKNSSGLRKKRDALLDAMHQRGLLTAEDVMLAKLETLPDSPKQLPNDAPHLTAALEKLRSGSANRTTLDVDIQKRCMEIALRHHQKLAGNGVHNAAVLVAKTATGEVQAYIGNMPAGLAHGEFVDVINASRSSGSILKPFLYNAMQRNGQLLPHQFMVDIPTFISGFNPENYSRDYQGVVPASMALAQSLNVPFVRALREFGVPLFKQELKGMGFSTVSRSADNYGLSLIIGGAEVTLWDVSAAYLGLAQSVVAANGKAGGGLHFLPDAIPKDTIRTDAGSAFLTLAALQSNHEAFGGDDLVNNYASRIAWKTGTSHGFRDAWAVGVTPDYVVAVWIGNADGEGRPGVVGVKAAAPLMFETFDALGDKARAFITPFDHLKVQSCCAMSGMLASANCPKTQPTWAAKGAENAKLCTYHQPVLVTADGRYRVSGSCQEQTTTIVNWFVLPPACAYYYKQKHLGYKVLPEFLPGCGTSSSKPMQLIYPSDFQKVVSTKQMSGETGGVVFKLAHSQPEKRVFWHANEIFLGETQLMHELPVRLPSGKYTLHVVDEDGVEIYQPFEVL
jgi:penicillin-binding protein 1C